MSKRLSGWMGGEVYLNGEKIGELVKREKIIEKKEKYTLEQITDAVTQADTEIVHAIQHKNRKGLEDVLRNYLV